VQPLAKLGVLSQLFGCARIPERLLLRGMATESPPRSIWRVRPGREGAMRLIDLSSPIDANFWEPEPVSMQTMSAAEGAKHLSMEMREHFGMNLDPSMLPGGEFLTNDTVTLTTHTGTHIDAPAHYGSVASYGVPRTIDEVPLDWFYRPGMLLDLTTSDIGVATADDLRREFDRVGRAPRPLDIVLLNTGSSRFLGTQQYFTDFVGLDDSAARLLLDHGVRVIGTDAFSLDAPFTYIISQYRQTGDAGVLWPAHIAGRTQEFCQIERLANLDSLPGPDGFTLVCFPVKVARAGAGWARAVAIVED
jgi:cyclase